MLVLGVGVTSVSVRGHSPFAAYRSPSGVAADLVLDYAEAKYSLDGTTGTTFATAHTFTRASSATYRDSTGTRQTAATDAERLDHTSSGTALGLLVEEQRTNQFLNSDSPATQTISLTATGDYTLWMEGTGSAAVAANTATGTGFGTATEGSPVTFNISGTGSVDVTITAPVTICQLEKGSFATSYIPTAGASVTRAADMCSVATADFGFSTTAGTVAFTGTMLGFVSNAHGWDFNDGTANNQISLYLPSAAKLFLYNGAVQADISGGAVVASTQFKSASAWAANDAATSLDGAAVVTDTTVTVPTGINDLHIGREITGLHMNGHIKKLVYYASRLPSSDLTGLST